MKNKKIVFATLAALGAQVIFGFSFMLTKIALSFASPMTVIANRYMVAFLSLSSILIFTKRKVKMNHNIWKLILMSLFQPFLYFIFETYGLKLTTSAFSSVMISMIPVASMVCGTFLLKEIPSPMQYLFTLLSITGVAIMSIAGKVDGTVTVFGIILLVGAVFSSAFYNITSRKISSEFSVFDRTYAMTVVGLIAFVTIAFAENILNPDEIINSFKSLEYTLAIIYLGVVSSVIAFLLLNFANTYLPVAKTTVFSNLTTVVSVIAGSLILNEKITFNTVFSVILIIAGVLGVQIIGIRKKSN